MLGIPAATPFDLNFRFLGIPVRVSPWFWVVGLMFNLRPDVDIKFVLIWMGCVFVSILIHELGHGLTSKAFGYRPFIVLHGMGGVCASEGERQTFGQRLAVLLMGPGAQFLLLGCVFLWVYVVWQVGPLADWYVVRAVLGFPYSMKDLTLESPAVRSMIELSKIPPMLSFVFWSLVLINLLWALINLLPIWPLDGGQICQTLLSRADPIHGPRRTHIIGMITAGGIAAYIASQQGSFGDARGNFFPIVFFGLFAFMNYQRLQAHHQHFVENGPDDADWWKR